MKHEDQHRSEGRRQKSVSTRAWTLARVWGYPNPSNGLVYLVYHVPNGVAHAEVWFSDMEGRVVHRTMVTASSGIAELDVREHATGLYTIALVLDGVRMEQLKLSLQH